MLKIIEIDLTEEEIKKLAQILEQKNLDNLNDFINIITKKNNIKFFDWIFIPKQKLSIKRLLEY